MFCLGLNNFNSLVSEVTVGPPLSIFSLRKGLTISLFFTSSLDYGLLPTDDAGLSALASQDSDVFRVGTRF
jgi:hypothetical protein